MDSKTTGKMWKESFYKKAGGGTGRIEYTLHICGGRAYQMDDLPDSCSSPIETYARENEQGSIFNCNIERLLELGWRWEE